MRKKPWLVGLLSVFFPGLGHIYAGKIKRGFILFFTWLITVFIISFFSAYSAGGLAFYIYLLLSNVVVILIIVDAVRCVRKENLNPSSAIKSKTSSYLVYGITYLVLVFFVLTALLKSVVVEAYKIPTGSMENTLLIGDYILGSKNIYGIHVPFSDDYLFHFSQPERNDLVIYKYYDLIESGKYEKNYYIKRCIGLPGEEFKIINKKVYIDDKELPECKGIIHSNDTLRPGATSRRIFPVSSGWNEDNYGPLKIPKAGEEVEINFSNIRVWEKLIKDEGNSLSFDGSGKITLNGKTAEEFIYKVKNDYVFLLGDNRNNSLDSRYKGFISVKDIMGKAKLIYLSLNKGNIRFDRIGREI